MQYHPKNIGNAIMCFIFGSLLIWWCSDKITLFTDMFDDAFPKMFIWISFVLLFLQWVLVIPFLISTGADDLDLKTLIKSFVNGLMGVCAIVIGLPIGSGIINALSNIFSDASGFISFIAWLCLVIIIAYTAIWRPIEIILPKNQTNQ